ncbi:MAG: ThiF family adenylyltransferase, partial [Terriglobales bacterium]
MFALAKERIDCEAHKQSLFNAKAGALATFEGWVRNHNEGREVLALAYEAYDALAVKEAEKIIAEAKERFEIYDASCIHRVGELCIGDVAVWVGAIAAHRGTAFDACRYIIDEIKHRLPIWKKETYTDGSSGWVNCQSGCHDGVRTDRATQDAAVPDITEADYYSRQIILHEVGESGQHKLKNAKVLVIGAGGLGSSALLYLAGAGVGTIGICDSDRVEPSNLHRQILFGRSSVGQLKAEAACARLTELNPFISILTHAQRFAATNAAQLVDGYDIILDCSDNFETKFLANDIALSTAKTLIQASIYQY